MPNLFDLPALDSRLLTLLESQEPLPAFIAAVDQFVIDYSPSEHWGPCSLFYENCREVWKREGCFYDTKLIAVDELDASRGGARDWLRTVCEEMLRFLLDSLCEPDYRKHAEQLKEAVRSYLLVRGHKVSLPATTKAAWSHSTDEPRQIEQFAFGPLTGTGCALDAAICNRTKPDPHFRQLKRKGREGRLWIVERTSTCFAVWFSDDGSYTTARRRLDNAATAADVVAKKPRSKTSRKRK